MRAEGFYFYVGAIRYEVLYNYTSETKSQSSSWDQLGTEVKELKVEQLLESMFTHHAECAGIFYLFNFAFCFAVLLIMEHCADI